MKTKLFRTEVDLCAAFIATLPEGWTPYAETAGWDILLVRGSDGFQIGIQAKLKLNALVMAQAIDAGYGGIGPDCRALLVPWDETAGIGMAFLCRYVGLTIIRISPAGERRGREFYPTLPGPDADRWRERWYELAPTERCKLPEYVPDVRAGDRSPLQLTAWKIGALKIAVLLEERGRVTRQDFKTAGIDHRRWIAPGMDWLIARDGAFVPGARLPDFKAQHPIVFEQVRADMAKWRKEAGGTLL